MIEKYVSMYHKGAITAHHLIVQCIQMVDPRNSALVLGHLPPELLSQLETYIRDYQSGPMISNYGPQPAIDQVEAAKHWIEGFASHQREKETKQDLQRVL